MTHPLLSLAAMAILSLGLVASAHGAGHGGGGGHGGGAHGGVYHGCYGHGGYGRCYAPHCGHGFYRPYYGYGLGFGLGLGLGYGLYGAYAPYYGYGYPAYGYAYGPPPYAAYSPGGYAPVGAFPGPPPPPAQGNGQTSNAPPQDNAAHLQLAVPANAEVIFQGARTTQTGTVREFTSAALTPGQSYTYKISVRYTDTNGRPVDDTRNVHVRANDWFSIDFTRPAPSNPPTAPPEPMPSPPGS